MQLESLFELHWLKLLLKGFAVEHLMRKVQLESLFWLELQLEGFAVEQLEVQLESLFERAGYSCCLRASRALRSSN